MIAKVPLEPASKLKLSWFLCKHETNDLMLLDPKNLDKKENVFLKACLCRLPGAMRQHLDNKKNKKLENEVKYLATQGVTHILCLINLYEMRMRNVDHKYYRALCQKNGIDLLVYEIMEMAAPQDEPNILTEKLISSLIEILSKNDNKLAIHCRAGVGRAGTIACCILLNLGLLKTVKVAIRYLREIRKKGCVESKKQKDYCNAYFKYLN